jgi:hypothetical protein
MHEKVLLLFGGPLSCTTIANTNGGATSQFDEQTIFSVCGNNSTRGLFKFVRLRRVRICSAIDHAQSFTAGAE